MITVLLVDDQALVRAGFAMLVGSQPDLSVVGEAGDGLAAVRAVRTLQPDVVLMDVRMPTMDGVEATREVVAAAPETKVIVLTTFDLDEYAFSALQAGASGFLLKDAPPEDLLDAIRVVHSGDAVVAPSTTRRLIERYVVPAGIPLRRSVADTLTEREREVWLAIARGLTNAEIAGELFVSEATVKTHVGHILAKTGMRDRVALVVLAYDSGAIGPG
ncbi:MAG: response regulator transcription factor [Candidatus Lutibacillus vidarii]|nr:response regulator transcription factor [Candidatus Lutibacillus vidarii]HON74501.1 response regulator transcription factor [Dermatophilaceae bacterium]HRC00307.1 response regulator transcription factor [Dermatophilaceae bacterium]